MYEQVYCAKLGPFLRWMIDFAFQRTGALHIDVLFIGHAEIAQLVEQLIRNE